MTSRLTIRPALLLCALIPSTALAHIDLLDPPARAHGTSSRDETMVDVNADQKSPPCGQIMNMRSDRVTRYAPGQTITLLVREEIPHDSYFRVSLDMQGDNDFPRREGALPETEEQALAVEEALDTEGTLLDVVRESNDLRDFVHEIEVTLPEETCTECTLQVTQFMYVNPAPYYHQCADLVIAEGDAEVAAACSLDPRQPRGTAAPVLVAGLALGLAARSRRRRARISREHAGVRLSSRPDVPCGRPARHQ